MKHLNSFAAGWLSALSMVLYERGNFDMSFVLAGFALVNALLCLQSSKETK